MANTPEAGTLNIRLADTLDIFTMRSLYSELRSALDNDAPVFLQGSEVERVDAAALQMLAAMFIFAADHQYRLELQSPSEALVHGAALLSVDEYMGLKARQN